MAMSLLSTAAIGAVVGVATGYAVYAASNSYSTGIIVWLAGVRLGVMDAILFAILGALVATELSFQNR